MQNIKSHFYDVKDLPHPSPLISEAQPRWGVVTRIVVKERVLVENLSKNIVWKWVQDMSPRLLDYSSRASLVLIM